ncbi:MAG: hypothetical protein E6R03_12245 [Hyphomicrobiaceae bacterium]|nr:MAG: hypothetical protein E6R03_12245 [Hyphomicrobiaceae bacterium]
MEGEEVIKDEELEEVVVDPEPDPDPDPKPEDGKDEIKDVLKTLEQTKLELAELKGRLAESIRKSEPEEKDWMDDEEFSEERLTADPATVKKLVKTLRAEIAQVLRQRDDVLRGEIKERVRSSVPRDEELLAKIQEMSEDQDYQDFTEEQIERLARKTLDGDRPAGMRSPRGPIGGRRIGAVPKQNDITKSPLFRAMYPDLVEDDKGGAK